jgi:hypothetical protein
MPNRYGLSRTIPSEIKRQVRQRCGFGCVKCGAAVYQYEHLDPPFADAQEHSADGIVLLCGACHDLRTREILSKETVSICARSPKCKELGFSFGPFDLGVVEPEITIGTLRCKRVKTLIRVFGEPIFSVDGAEESGAPFRINAFLADEAGQEIFRIEDNEWQTTTENWDVEVKGANITIRQRLGNIALSLRSEPPSGLVIEKLEMMHRGVRILCTEGQKIQVILPNGRSYTSSGTEIDGAQVGVDVTQTGIGIGFGGGSTFIKSAVLIPASVRPPSFPSQPQCASKVRRNEKCPCGSGVKYKRCHGSLRQQQN